MNSALTWNPSELEQIQPYLIRIKNGTHPRHHTYGSNVIKMSAEEIIELKLEKYLPGLRTGIPVRHILLKLGFYEKQALKLRLEHKLIQALILRHYCEDAVPVTCGLNALVASENSSCLEELLIPHHNPKLILKKTLGFCGSRQRSYVVDRDIITNAISIQKAGALPTATVEQEQHIVQDLYSNRSGVSCPYAEDKIITV